MHSTPFVVISGVLAIVLLVVLITRVKLHPFFALLISSILLGIVNGLGVTDAVGDFTDGFGSQLSVTGVVIGLGAMLGGILIRTGGGDKIADVIIGKRKLVWMPISVGLVALIIGLPNLFEVTFVLMVPLVFSIAKRLGVPVLTVGVPMTAGLMTAHGLLPPGPATVLAATAYKASIGEVTLYGVIIAVPVLLVGAWLFPRLMRRYLTVGSALDISGGSGSGDKKLEPTRQVGLAPALTSVLIAPVLMIIGTLGLDSAPKNQLFQAIGNPVISLSLAVLFGFVFLGRGAGFSADGILSLVKTSIVPIVGLLLIIGAGGGLKNMLTAIGLSDIVSGLAKEWSIPVLLFAWIVAAIFRIALGSGTVAVSASSGIVAALLAANPGTNSALLVLATCTGAMIFSHVSDGAFWIFKEYFGLTVPQTLRTWSLQVTVMSVVGLIGVLILGATVH
ncbi:gluconate:H+ symporter [Frondihabitans australicus]|uniref:GntP family gluconate:H+ symporter n=1 Tax=Frondihabitans australicus TaxID=386892 RepID=A0A495IMX9_9MICO|nr:gluconate:H+ symporter [Frondihabitans australicus]RKR76541.1 GntP family gluconate:H+ symporter [Frondihabitans australicus]